MMQNMLDDFDPCTQELNSFSITYIMANHCQHFTGFSLTQALVHILVTECQIVMSIIPCLGFSEA